MEEKGSQPSLERGTKQGVTSLGRGGRAGIRPPSDPKVWLAEPTATAGDGFIRRSPYLPPDFMGGSSRPGLQHLSPAVGLEFSLFVYNVQWDAEWPLLLSKVISAQGQQLLTPSSPHIILILSLSLLMIDESERPQQVVFRLQQVVQ